MTGSANLDSALAGLIDNVDQIAGVVNLASQGRGRPGRAHRRWLSESCDTAKRDVASRTMHETMRDHLKGKARAAAACAVAAIVLVIVTIFAKASGALTGDYAQFYGVAKWLGFALVAIGGLIRGRIKCPKCGNTMPVNGLRIGLPSNCPNCGVSLDEPVPSNPISPAP
jgi:ribosomal protein S27AE